jgi:KDO2-lipid IV(A) lauroyltransferase
MALQTFLNSRRAAKLAFWLSRLLPQHAGLRLTQRIARRVATRQDLPLVQALRLNQWVVAGGRLHTPELDRAVQECLEQVGFAFFHLFRSSQDTAALDELVAFNDRIDEIIARSQEKRHGLMVAGLHMSGFDLVSQAAARRGLRAIALSLPEENSTVAWQHEFRRRSGLEILPGTLPNLRHALQRLSAGELVLTGIDRPTPGQKYRPCFFGRPAPLPTHHIYLAQKAGVPVVVMSTVFDGQRYQILTSEELRLKTYPNRSEEMTLNAECVLQAAEAMICQAPQQWVVPHPVWPSLASELSSSVR